MSWHFKPNPNRWEKFFDEERFLIYSLLLLSGDPNSISEERKNKITKKLVTELTGWINDMKKDGVVEM